MAKAKRKAELKPLIPTKEAAAMLGVSTSRISQMVTKGKLDVAERHGLYLLFDRGHIEKVREARLKKATAALNRLKTAV